MCSPWFDSADCVACCLVLTQVIGHKKRHSVSGSVARNITEMHQSLGDSKKLSAVVPEARSVGTSALASSVYVHRFILGCMMMIGS